MDTVVEVGIPKVLKTSKSRISVIITAIKMYIMFWKLNMAGLKMPLRATSIIPLEVTAPTKTPKLAIINMFLVLITLEPIAEFKKLTASLLTPTIKSTIASTARAAIIKI